MDFQNKVALITGSSRGIGATIAKAFAAEGATVVVNYLQNEGAGNFTSQPSKLPGQLEFTRAITSGERLPRSGPRT